VDVVHLHQHVVLAVHRKMMVPQPRISTFELSFYFTDPVTLLSSSEKAALVSVMWLLVSF
jgi:hypothetical protein